MEGEGGGEGAIIDSLNRRLADGRLAWCQVNENFGWFCLLNLHTTSLPCPALGRPHKHWEQFAYNHGCCLVSLKYGVAQPW